MKKNILKSMIFGVIGCLFTSCFSDLDTMPLDDNQLVGEKVYQTADGYTGVLAKCYSSLILTGQKGGDGGDGDLEGANEGYSSYVRLMFYLQELPTDNFIMPSHQTVCASASTCSGTNPTHPLSAGHTSASTCLSPIVMKCCANAPKAS